MADTASDALESDKKSDASDRDRWTIRGVPEHERDLALAASRRAKRPLGEWLAEAIRAYVSAERGGSGVALPPTEPRSDVSSDLSAIVSDNAASIATLVEASCRLASTKHVPKAVRAAANRAVAASLAGHVLALPAPPAA